MKLYAYIYLPLFSSSVGIALYKKESIEMRCTITFEEMRNMHLIVIGFCHKM